MEEKKTKELSLEEIKNIAGQLQQQNVQLRQALQRANYENLFKRLDYLFKVLDNAHMFDIDFVEECTTEIQESIRLPKDEESQESSEGVKEE